MEAKAHHDNSMLNNSASFSLIIFNSTSTYNILKFSFFLSLQQLKFTLSLSSLSLLSVNDHRNAIGDDIHHHPAILVLQDTPPLVGESERPVSTAIDVLSQLPLVVLGSPAMKRKKKNAIDHTSWHWLSFLVLSQTWNGETSSSFSSLFSCFESHDSPLL